MRVLILGASGLIGSAMAKVISASKRLNVTCAVRRPDPGRLAEVTGCQQWVSNVDMTNLDQLNALILRACPSVVINCVGLTKHVPGSGVPLNAISVNALLPQRLCDLCELIGARLIHVSTDCVFSGKKGNYSEEDVPDAPDIYGKTKFLGEVTASGHVTLRTSTIGHEWETQFGLLDWFLAQKSCKGYKNAIFSGLPSQEFARVVRDFVIPNKSLQGLFHVGGKPIDKYSLLHLISQIYDHKIKIELDESVVIDRSLNSTLFNAATGYQAPEWPKLIKAIKLSQH